MILRQQLPSAEQEIEKQKQVLPPSALINAQTHCLLGLLLEDERDWPGAELAYRAVLEAAPAYSVGLERLGSIYLHYKETIPQALNCFAKSIELNPMNAKNWYLLGRCYMAAGSYQDAKECYNRSINLNSNDEDCWCSIGILYYAYGQYRESLGFFSRALRLNHTMCDAWYNVGALYDICGQKNEAEDAYLKARNYGFAQRLGNVGLVLDLSDVSSRKRKKKRHEIGASLAAYHGDSVVAAARHTQLTSQSKHIHQEVHSNVTKRSETSKLTTPATGTETQRHEA